MLERIVRSTTVRSTIAFALTCALVSGCSYASAQKRQQLAYAKYVSKYSHKRVKQQTKFKKWKMPFTPPSDPTVTTAVGAAPQSVSSNEGGN